MLGRACRDDPVDVIQTDDTAAAIASRPPSGVATHAWVRIWKETEAPLGHSVEVHRLGDRMIVVRVLGWLLIVLAVATAGHEAIASLDAGAYKMLAFGGLWAKIDIASLNLIQAVVQRYVWVWLWDGVIVNLLLLPAWAVLSVPGILMVLGFRERGGSRRRGNG